MRLKCFIFFFTFCFGFHLFSQNFDHYEPARCAGEVPEDFLKLSSDKAKEAIAAVQNKDIGRREKRDEESYEISTNFLVDELLSSGQILFGDSMTIFVNRIADKLLEDEPELRKELRFYTYRSAIPNAYATHTGVVLISIGLLARVENEAQIACILGHEIQHYVRKHSLKQFKKAKQLRRDLGNISRVEMDVRLKEMYRFSQEAESEADMLGFRLLQKSGYNMHEGLAVFDMLRYSEYPFLEISLTHDSFASNNYHFPKNITDEISKMLESKILLEEEDEDDENSSHPSLSKRINVLKDLLETENIPNTGLNNLISESAFNRLQRQSRCELLMLYIRSSNFGKAIYLSKVMEALYGKTHFTDKIYAMGWYGLGKHRLLYHDLDEYGCNLKYSVGDWRPFLAMIRSLNAKELATLAMRELYLVSSENSTDPWFANLRDEVFKGTQYQLNIRLEDYLAFKPATPETPLVLVDSMPKTTEPVVKNPKDRAKSKSAVNSSQEWFYAAFYDLNQADSLRAYFKRVRYESSETGGALPLTKKERKAAEKVIDVHSVALFEPTFTQFDISGSGESKKKYFNEEAMVATLSRRLQDMGKNADMGVTIVSGSNKERLTVDDMNRYMVLNDWFIERMNNDTNAMSLWNYQYASPIMDDLGTSHLGWVGFRSVVAKRPFQVGTLLASMLFYPTFPFYLVWQFGKEKEFSYVSLVFDTRTGSASSFQSNSFSHGLKTDFLNAQLYQVLYNIQHANTYR